MSRTICDACDGEGYTDMGRSACAACLGTGVTTPEMLAALNGRPALAEAEARGRRQGLEEAALVCEAGAKDWIGARAGKSALAFAKVAIRSLATTPAGTQKPETGESANLTDGAS